MSGNFKITFELFLRRWNINVRLVRLLQEKEEILNYNSLVKIRKIYVFDIIQLIGGSYGSKRFGTNTNKDCR